MMDRDFKQVQKRKVSDRVRRTFLSIITSQRSVSNDQRYGRPPRYQIIVKPSLIPDIPDCVEQVDDCSSNNDFALWRPVQLT
jgi:hypothetical protein